MSNIIIPFLFFEYIGFTACYILIQSIKNDGLIHYREDVIKHIIIILLPLKTIWLIFQIFVMFKYIFTKLSKRYELLPSKKEKIKTSEKAQKQSGNLSIAETNDNGGLSII